MRISGLQKNSLVDYPGCIAAVIFTPGCNFDCFYCHNWKLIDENTLGEKYSEENILSFLETRKGLLDGVVITGGEPTLQKDLKDFIHGIKKMGFLIKLDTNGTNPSVIEELTEQKLIDYIAMDIKAPFCKYDEFSGGKTDLNTIKRSISIIMDNCSEYEFRTTVVPQLGEDDIVKIASLIEGAQNYVLQQYKKPPLRPIPDYRLFQKPHDSSFFENVCGRIASKVQKCIIRGVTL